MGRLAAVVAKQLLAGRHVVCVRTEQLDISGPIYRNKVKFHAFLNKADNCQPEHGPIHFRAPSMIFWRCVRGMLPHKTKRGAAALSHFKVLEGMPQPYDTVKKEVVPAALRVLRLKPGPRTRTSALFRSRSAGSIRRLSRRWRTSVTFVPPLSTSASLLWRS